MNAVRKDYYGWHCAMAIVKSVWCNAMTENQTCLSATLTGAWIPGVAFLCILLFSPLFLLLFVAGCLLLVLWTHRTPDPENILDQISRISSQCSDGFTTPPWLLDGIDLYEKNHPYVPNLCGVIPSPRQNTSCIVPWFPAEGPKWSQGFPRIGSEKRCRS